MKKIVSSEELERRKAAAKEVGIALSTGGKTEFGQKLDMTDQEIKEKVRTEPDQISKRLRALKTDRKFQYNDFAFYDDDTYDRRNPRLSKVFNGKQRPDLEFLIALHYKYGVSLDWLIAGDDSTTLTNPDNGLKSALEMLEKAVEIMKPLVSND